MQQSDRQDWKPTHRVMDQEMDGALSGPCKFQCDYHMKCSSDLNSRLCTWLTPWARFSQSGLSVSVRASSGRVSLV